MDPSHDAWRKVVETYRSVRRSEEILTNKTWSADDDPIDQNDRQLKLYTKINFVGTISNIIHEIYVTNYFGLK